MSNHCCTYTVQDIAEMLQLNKNTVYSHIRNNIFPFPVHHIGRKYFVSAEVFDDFLKNGFNIN